MITIRAGNGAIGICLLLLLTGCSREQQDWRSAEAADTIDGYGTFIQRHPESELVTQARMRVAQLGEDRDWQHAGSADTVGAYRDFLSQHPNGKWAQEARIRIENFSLGEQAGTDAASRGAAGNGAGVGVGGGGRRSAGNASGAGGRAAPEAGVAAADTSSSAEQPEGLSGDVAGSTPGGRRTAVSGGTGSLPTDWGDRGPAGPVASADGVAPRGAAANPGAGEGRGLAAPGEAAVPAVRLGSAAGRSIAGTADATVASGAHRASGGAGVSGGGTGGSGTGGAEVGGGTAGGAGASDAGTAGAEVGGGRAGGAGASSAGAGGAGAGAGPARAGSFGIQLGAFSSEAAANNEWRLLTGRFGPELQGLQEHVVTAETPSGRVYRLQAVVGAEARARAICDSLRKRSQGCVAVLPH